MYVSTHMHQCVHACRRVYVSMHTEGMGAGCSEEAKRCVFVWGKKGTMILCIDSVSCRRVDSLRHVSRRVTWRFATCHVTCRHVSRDVSPRVKWRVATGCWSLTDAVGRSRCSMLQEYCHLHARKTNPSHELILLTRALVSRDTNASQC